MVGEVAEFQQRVRIIVVYIKLKTCSRSQKSFKIITGYLNYFYCKVIIWSHEVSFSYFLCFVGDFTIINRFDSFSNLE